MKWVLFVAKRYLFASKKQGLVHWISIISMVGVAIGIMALICVLSIINGLDQKVHQTYTDFVPDLEIISTQGSVFSVNDSCIQKILNDSIHYQYVGKRMVQQALVTKNGIQLPVVLTGVDTTYYETTSLQKSLWTGSGDVHHTKVPMTVVGLGIANELATGKDLVVPAVFYIPKRQVKVNLMRPDAAFKKVPIYIGGIVNVDIECVDRLVLLPFHYVQSLYDYSDDQVTSLALSVRDQSNIKNLEEELEIRLPPKYQVRNRQEANADLYQMLRIEKWMTFLILFFIVVISICNVIGSLSMLIIDKEQDIQVFKNLGVPHATIIQLFWLEGWMITIVGTVIGGLVALLLCYGQATFSWIMMGKGAYAIPYPVVVQWTDLVLILVSVLFFGALVAYYPAYQLRKKIM